MHKLVLLRHGESLWNKSDLFTGWTDVDLSQNGQKEAKEAGNILKAEGYHFDVSFTSYLKRAINTLHIVLEELDELWIPVHKTWKLNERHYGALQGLHKKETAKEHGEQMMQTWRRSFNISPPLLDKNDKRSPYLDRRYQNVEEVLPLGECLEDTIKRVIPYWEMCILPLLQKGFKVLVCAHGNSLRALVKHLDKISDQQIVKLNIPTGIPLVYDLDESCEPIQHYYLGDQEAIAQAILAVSKQGQVKP